ncbi:hypothetical protein [Sporosarcina limicola]|uniref:Uncharacterized protein n=1 Tax=Sporosarcina limicola TaxID=34101 RepID=A0A927MH02_9BACL|nr:hypothetical protein [Sporosarcina limicola]MBE1554453.1 hypothetical protein [Sporosarcina limicola]
MEKGVKIKFTDKEYWLFTILLLLMLIIIITLSAFSNFYPGGYLFETSDNEVFIEKGTLKKETYNFTITKDNELRIALLESNIDQLKIIWYVSLISMTAILIGAVNFLRLKNKIFFKFTLFLFILFLIIIFISYMNYINNNIESLILNLKRT